MAAKTHSDIIAECEGRMLDLHTRNESIQAQADADVRELSQEEENQIRANSTEFQRTKVEIERRKTLMEQSAQLTRVQPAATQPAPTRAPSALPNTAVTEFMEGPRSAWGWRSFGEFVKGVINASVGRQPDPRFQAAATIYGNETTAADGQYALPPDFRDTLIKKVQGENSLLPLTDQYISSSNKITLPVDAVAPWAASGIQAAWTGEGVAITATKPVLTQVEIQAHKLAALCPLTDEAIEDIPSLNSWLPGKIAEVLVSAINEAILCGDDTGKPDGIIGSGGQVVVTSAKVKDVSVGFADVVQMFSAMNPAFVNQSIWLINPSVMPQLLSLVGPGYAPGAWMPPNNSLANAPYGTLLGRPVIAQEHCKYLGTLGDIVFWHPKSYVTVTKASGIRSDTSMHLYFDQGISALRVTTRLGGKNLWAGTLAGKNTVTYGNVIVLNGTRS